MIHYRGIGTNSNRFADHRCYGCISRRFDRGCKGVGLPDGIRDVLAFNQQEKEKDKREERSSFCQGMIVLVFVSRRLTRENAQRFEFNADCLKKVYIAQMNLCLAEFKRS